MRYGSVPTEWFECAVDVPHECSEIVASFLIDNGAPGLQADERGHVTTLIAYFSDEPPLDALRRLCADIGCPLGEAVAIRVRHVPQEDWAENWKSHFRPRNVGEALRICPPWDVRAGHGRIVVVIDPGMAFGTGQHATTYGCLLLLERALAARPEGRALDIGTGSGILGIALAKLGVMEVWAIDTDPVARAIAARNAQGNGVAVRIGRCLDEAPGTFDVVAANLYSSLLAEIAAPLVERLTAGGVLVCSGFQTGDEPRVRRAYETRGLRCNGRHEEESWVTLALESARP